jgi:hypothetical protein
MTRLCHQRMMPWIIAVGLLTPANAQGSTPTHVELEVTVIHATKDGGNIDEKLTTLTRYLKKSFKDFKGFKHLKSSRQTASMKGTMQVDLPTNAPLKLSGFGWSDGAITLRLQHGSLDTQVKVQDGGLFFQAGRGYRGGILVLAIRARSTKQ